MGALLDAYALVALLRDEPAAADVEAILARGDVAMPAINLAEAADRVARIDRVGIGDLRALVDPLGISIVPLTERAAWRAGELRARHYRRRHGEVSIADCCLVAAATPLDTIVTGDRAVLRMARAEGVPAVELATA